jgi:phosphoribosyl 1,2-cyclic phosphate phosphodiesterase
MTRRFDYIFKSHGGYPAICEARTIPPHGQPWSIEGPSGSIPVATFDQDHGQIRSVGYRLGPVAYSSDVVGLPEKSFAMLKGVKLWIVDALRFRAHPTHANVKTALSWIKRVKPERAILTNLHMDLDYRELARSLPDGVEPAYDGMSIELILEER